MITDLSSLKNGVTKEVILAEITRREQRISIGPNRRRGAKAINFDDYCHIINKEETRGFFGAIKRVYRMILQYASSDSVKRGGKTPKNKGGNISRASNDSSSPFNSDAQTKDGESNSSPTEEGSYSESTGLARDSILETNRSLTENEPLHGDYSTEESIDASRGLSLSYTMDDTESSRLDEEKEAKKKMK